MAMEIPLFQQPRQIKIINLKKSRYVEETPPKFPGIW